MDTLVTEYKQWRKAEGLPWNPNFVPKSYVGLADLEHEYWKKEQAAIALEKELAAKNALPPARPRRKPQRTVTTLKNGDLRVKPNGYVTGDDLKAFLDFLKSEMDDINKATQLALNERLKWRGTWRTGESYALNDLVQDKGTVFVAVAPKAEGRPGTDAGWRMLVKTQGAAK